MVEGERSDAREKLSTSRSKTRQVWSVLPDKVAILAFGWRNGGERPVGELEERDSAWGKRCIEMGVISVKSINSKFKKF